MVGLAFHGTLKGCKSIAQGNALGNIEKGQMTDSLHTKRMAEFQKAGIYFVTSETMSEGRSTLDIIKSAIAGGISLVQLREKQMPTRKFFELAREARAITSQAGALLIINDRPDIALAVDADGVHLGQDDFPISEARRLAPDLIIGSSSHNIEEALLAEQMGASYVNIGPLFPTKTKEWKDDFLGMEGLKEISNVVQIPFTVMGGIKKEHIPDLIKNGARTIALVTAITAAKNPDGAAHELLSFFSTTR